MEAENVSGLSQERTLEPDWFDHNEAARKLHMRIHLEDHLPGTPLVIKVRNRSCLVPTWSDLWGIELNDTQYRFAETEELARMIFAIHG